MRGLTLASWLEVGSVVAALGLLAPSPFGWTPVWRVGMLLAAVVVVGRTLLSRAVIDDQGVRVRKYLREHSLRWDEISSVSCDAVGLFFVGTLSFGRLVVDVPGRVKPLPLETTTGASIEVVEQTVAFIRFVAPGVPTDGVKPTPFPNLGKGMRRERRRQILQDGA